MMATFKLFTLISALLLIILSPSVDGVTVKIEVRNFPFLNRIFLDCLDTEDANLETNNIGLIRTYTLDGQLFTETFTDFTIEELGVVKFTVTPEIEGNYFCVDKDTNTTSSNSVKIVGKENYNLKLANLILIHTKDTNLRVVSSYKKSRNYVTLTYIVPYGIRIMLGVI